MGKWKSKLKHKTNRRGGDHYFELSTTLRSKDEMFNNGNYGNVPRNRLDDLEVGDIVKVTIISSHLDPFSSYVRILEFIDSERIKGVIDDTNTARSGAHCQCNICGRYSFQEESKGDDDLYCCYGDISMSCDFHVHKKCMNKVHSKNKLYDCKLSRAHFQNGSIVYFKKNNIFEIP